MPEGDPILWQLLLQALLIIINAVFACAEIAVISVSDSKLALLAASGDKRAQRLVTLTADPSRFFATIQVGITFAGFLGSAFAADNFAGRFASWLEVIGLPLTYETAQTISLVLITVLLSYVTLVLGELVPKRIARQKAEAVALALSGLVVFLSRVFQPVVWFLTISNNAILRLIGIDPEDDTKEVTEEEIRMMVDEGNVAGAIAADEKYIINNVFEFNDTPAVELMTHRTDVDLLWTEDSDAKWEETIRKSRHSHYPVVGEDADDVQGVLLSKEYFRLDRRDRETVLAGAVRPAQFVPESVMANVLFRNMKNNRNHFAVVLDEYAGMSGVITINDLLEQLVGDLDDDNTQPPEEPEVVKLSDNEWEIRGTAPLDELSLELGTALPSEDYETFSGWVFGALGEVPDDGETPTLELNGFRIKITHIAEHKIERAIVQRIVDDSE